MCSSDLELGGDAIVGHVNANQYACASQKRHRGVADFERPPAGKSQLHGLEGPTGEHLAEGLDRHNSILPIEPRPMQSALPLFSQRACPLRGKELKLK